MSELADEGCVSDNRLRTLEEEGEDASLLMEVVNDAEDSVFTAWDDKKENSECSNHLKEEPGDIEASNQYLRYEEFMNEPPSPQDREMQDGERTPHASSDLTAALQTEKEFLNFMSSLPQIQEENKETLVASSDGENRQKVAKPAALPKPAPMIGNVSHVGLNHLDNLCKMIEQLKELKEQNHRLQSRVHYLEDLKAFQDMHNDMVSGDSTFGELVLRDLNLSASDLRLEEIPESPVFRRDSDESLDSFTSNKKIEVKDVLLDLPPEAIHLRSSSDDDSRRTESTEAPSTGSKEKKTAKTTWGKVKNIMNYSKKDAIRKKPQSLDPPIRKRPRITTAMSVTSPKSPPSTYREPTAVSDPEEYDIDCEPYDGDGSSWDWEGEIEAGIWINPKRTDFPHEYFFGNETVSQNRKKKRPHLTITVPSCEDVSMHNVIAVENLRQREVVGKISPESTGSSKDRKHSPNYSTTPPSPRRTSHWSKVKQAFLTGHNQGSSGRQTQKTKANSYTSPPNSPAKRQGSTSFIFDGPETKTGETDDGFSPELSPSLSLDKSRMEESSPNTVQGLQKNLMDLQKTLTGEFTKKLSEWEKLKKATGQESLSGQRWPNEIHHGLPLTENIPFEFRKKMNDWDKVKLKERDKAGHISMPMNILHFNQSHQQSAGQQKDLKTKNYEEETLPPDFKKKLTEWHVRKALVGKCEHNVEEIQKNLGEDFNKKMTEWERMKAQAKATVESDIIGVPLDTCIQPLSQRREELGGRVRNRASFPVGAKLTSLAGAAAVGATSFVMPSSLDRKGSAQKMKKNKAKEDKISSMKGENIPKNRNKELQWLEKELSKIDREKQRLEREKEKFLEREARLEKMKYAMKERQPQTKEIYIKTSTGEFRFEGISQTFTKKLYEWEVRRGIRPESSTFILLDPNYKAPGEATGEDKPKTPEPKRLVKSKSESSLAERAVASINSNASTASLNEEKDDGQLLQIDNKAASEPTLPTEESKLDRQSFAILIPNEGTCPKVAQEECSSPDVKESMMETNQPYSPPYAPDEITRLIDSSESEERYRYAENDSIWNGGSKDGNYIKRSNSVKSEEDYRSLLHENMTLLGQLKEKENVCRAIETQMGDLDYKMDNVADQHIRTLEKLHRQVNIMRKSESFGKTPTGENYLEETESERNRLLIVQLKSRIAELEEKGDRLMEEKEELECAFNLHKEQETQIAESLLLRIRELQEAGAEVNIQTVQCQTDDLYVNESHETSDEKNCSYENHDISVPVKKKRRRKRDDSKTEQRSLMDDDSEDEHVPPRRSAKDQKDGRRKRKLPPRNVQKLHNLTADLLFQAKRLEQGIIAKHNIYESGNKKVRRTDSLENHIARNRSLKTQRSLRIPIKENEENVYPKLVKSGTGKTWSSIEAIGTDKISDQWESKASAILFESQDLLKMNSDLARMARELRKEMTNIWSFKDSPSESNSSDNRVEHMESRIETDLHKLEKEDAKLDEEETWLAAQATEVFKSIASLQSDKTLWPSSRELSLDEEASKLNLKKESICSTTDEGNDPPETPVTELFKFDDIYNRNQLEENYISRTDSTLNETPTEREGTFLDDNFSFRVEPMSREQSGDKSNQNERSADCKDMDTFSNDALMNPFDPMDQLSPSSYVNDLLMKDQYSLNQEIYEDEGGLKFSGDTKTDDDHPDSVSCKNNLLRKVVIQTQPMLKMDHMPSDQRLDGSAGVHTSKKYRFPKILPYEMEISQLLYKGRSPGKYLRTRRVSDSQIDYKELTIHKNVQYLYKNTPFPCKLANNVSPFRRNQSENNVLLLTSENNCTEGNNIFVPTKRTVFTVVDKEGSIAHVNKSIIENEIIERTISNKQDNKSDQSLKEWCQPIDNPESTNFHNLDDSKTSNVPGRTRKSNDIVLNKERQEILLTDLHSQDETGTPLSFDQYVHKSSSPLGYKSFPRRSGNSLDNSKTKGFKAVIDIFSNRITRNQQLLMNPFSMGDPFIEVKKRQALSSDYIDVLNSEENITSIYLGLGLSNNKISEQPFSNYSLNDCKTLISKNLIKDNNDNEKLLPTSDDFTNDEVSYRKSKLKRAKDEFFHEILNSSEDVGFTDDRGIKFYEPFASETSKDSERHQKESRLVSCQNEESLLDKGASTSTVVWPPPKPPRLSISGVDYRNENNARPKAERNSLLSNFVNNKFSKSIMKMFRKEKSTEIINQSTVEVLCRQSLNVDVNERISATSAVISADCNPSTSRLNETVDECQMIMTLPRSTCALKNSPSSHSCPSTPIIQQKSKPSKWFERSRKMLKGKAPSPVKKSRYH